LASSRSWDDIVTLRERCAEALERGKQVWAAAEYGAYRLALDAPGSFAAAAVVSGAGRHTLGPLWEVAASSHTWGDLELHLPDGVQRELVARERALRGDDVGSVPAETYDIPVASERWEPQYPVATYRRDGADFPEPAAPSLAPAAVPASFTAVDGPDADVAEALQQLVAPWSESASGSVSVVEIEGSAIEAIAALGRGDVMAAPLSAAAALARMAWAGASGGAHGRRRGASVGRYNAWWAAAHLAGVDWPPQQLGEAVAELEWVAWRPAALTEGWELHLAIADPEHGVAWAVAATDVTEELEARS
jgi:hypothetical protein